MLVGRVWKNNFSQPYGANSSVKRARGETKTFLCMHIISPEAYSRIKTLHYDCFQLTTLIFKLFLMFMHVFFRLFYSYNSSYSFNSGNCREGSHLYSLGVLLYFVVNSFIKSYLAKIACLWKVILILGMGIVFFEDEKINGDRKFIQSVGAFIKYLVEATVL